MLPNVIVSFEQLGQTLRWATSSEKVSLNMSKMHRFRFISRMRKVSSRHLLSMAIQLVSNDYVSGQ